jgi:hypothetical protein
VNSYSVAGESHKLLAPQGFLQYQKGQEEPPCPAERAGKNAVSNSAAAFSGWRACQSLEALLVSGGRRRFPICNKLLMIQYYNRKY